MPHTGNQMNSAKKFVNFTKDNNYDGINLEKGSFGKNKFMKWCKLPNIYITSFTPDTHL